MAGDMAYEIRQKDERAFEDGDHVQVVGKVVADVERELGDALLNLCLGE